MADPFVLAHVKNLPIFKSLPPEQLEAIAEAFEVFQVPPNTLIFQAGQTLPGMYLLVQGRAYLLRTGADGQEQVVGEIVPYQYLGEAALFKTVTETRTLRVIESVLLLFLSRERFEQVLELHPQLRVNINSKHAPFAEAHKPLFKGQRPNEKVVVIQKRHPWSAFRLSLLPILLGLALVAAGVVFFAGSWFSLVLIGLGFVLPAVWGYYMYLEWGNDAVIITDQRVIQVENVLWKLESNINEVPLSNVQEVSYNYPPADLFSRWLRYGTLEIKTAGSFGNMRLDYIPYPENLQKILLSDKENYHRTDNEKRRDAIRAEIDRFLVADEQAQTGSQQAERKSAPSAPVDVGPFSTRFIDENGDIIYRKHLSIWFMHIFLPLILITIGVIVTLLGLTTIDWGSTGIIGAIGGFVLVLIGAVWLYWADWDWRNDLLILGDDTVTLIHKRPLFLQNVSDQILLSRVDNVVSDRVGILDTLLNRGTVKISLIGDDKGKAKVFKDVYNPVRVQEEITGRRAAVLNRAREEEVQRQRREIAEYIDVYHERISSAQAQQAQMPQPQPTSPPPPTPATDRTQPPIRGGVRPPRVPRVRSD